jgi:SAM-dependent methyltransferase
VTAEPSEPYYRDDLALVHDRGFGFHAAACAPGILEHLRPVLARDGLVLEIGCGSGLLTQELLAAGHRVLATDASPPMLRRAGERLGGGAQAVELLRLPDDPIPVADAIVAIGHPLNYLPDLAAFERAVVALAGALRPGGIIAFDACDLSWGRRDLTTQGRIGDDWAIITEFSVPARDRFVREITTFVRADASLWRRDHERHENVLVDVTEIPRLLADHGVTASVRPAFGTEVLPSGLFAIVGNRRAGGGSGEA